MLGLSLDGDVGGVNTGEKIFLYICHLAFWNKNCGLICALLECSVLILVT